MALGLYGIDRLLKSERVAELLGAAGGPLGHWAPPGKVLLGKTAETRKRGLADVPGEVGFVTDVTAGGVGVTGLMVAPREGRSDLVLTVGVVGSREMRRDRERERVELSLNLGRVTFPGGFWETDEPRWETDVSVAIGHEYRVGGRTRELQLTLGWGGKPEELTGKEPRGRLGLFY